MEDSNKLQQHSSRNSALDICRLFFVIVVIMTHFEGMCFPKAHRNFEGGYLAAEFYFVVAGFFLYRDFLKGRHKNALSYTASRYLQFFSYTFIVRLGLLVYELYAARPQGGYAGAGDMLAVALEKLSASVGELFLGQMLVPSKMPNSPIWFLSAMLMAGLALYLILDLGRLPGRLSGGKSGAMASAADSMPGEQGCPGMVAASAVKDPGSPGSSRGFGKAASLLLILLLTLLCYWYFFTRYRTLDVHMDPINLGFALPEGIVPCAGILRAFADMGLGVLFSSAFERVRLQSPLWTVLALVLAVLMALCIFEFSHRNSDFLFVLMMGLFTGISFADSWGAGHIPQIPPFISRLSFGVYVCHMLVLRCWVLPLPVLAPLRSFGELQSMVIYALLCIAAGAVLELIVFLQRGLRPKRS